MHKILINFNFKLTNMHVIFGNQLHANVDYPFDNFWLFPCIIPTNLVFCFVLNG